MKLLPSDTTVHQGLFAKVVKLGGYKSPVYVLRLDQSYAPYVRAINWKRCNIGFQNRYTDRVYGTPTALIQRVKELEAKEKAFGKNKGDQLWLDGFHPIDEQTCDECGAFHSA